jgi:hypothetical protein
MMTTSELIRRLTEVDPEGNREVYITAWFGNNEPLTDTPDRVYIDDEDDLMISGMLQVVGSGGAPCRRTDATRLTSFHAIMLVLATLLVVVLMLNVMQP